jgi:hypothetical protein
MLTFPSLCWHDICNVVRGEQMSDKILISGNRPHDNRQQEKLRIARAALARVEAKYALKRREEQHVERPESRRAQEERVSRYVS